MVSGVDKSGLVTGPDKTPVILSTKNIIVTAPPYLSTFSGPGSLAAPPLDAAFSSLFYLFTLSACACSFEVTVTSVSLPPCVSHRRLFNLSRYKPTFSPKVRSSGLISPSPSSSPLGRNKEKHTHRTKPCLGLHGFTPAPARWIRRERGHVIRRYRTNSTPQHSAAASREEADDSKHTKCRHNRWTPAPRLALSWRRRQFIRPLLPALSRKRNGRLYGSGRAVGASGDAGLPGVLGRMPPHLCLQHHLAVLLQPFAPRVSIPCLPRLLQRGGARTWPGAVRQQHLRRRRVAEEEGKGGTRALELMQRRRRPARQVLHVASLRAKRRARTNDAPRNARGRRVEHACRLPGVCHLLARALEHRRLIHLGHRRSDRHRRWARGLRAEASVLQRRG